MATAQPTGQAHAEQAFERLAEPFRREIKLCQGRSKRGSSSHLMKSGQDFGVFVLVWNLGGSHNAQA
jgi:hypothetical protein